MRAGAPSMSWKTFPPLHKSDRLSGSQQCLSSLLGQIMWELAHITVPKMGQNRKATRFMMGTPTRGRACNVNLRAVARNAVRTQSQIAV